MNIEIIIDGDSKNQNIELLYDEQLVYREIVPTERDISFYFKNTLDDIINSVRSNVIEEF